MKETVKMWLDDRRDPRVHLPRKFPDVEWTEDLFDEWVWVKTRDEAVALLQTGTVVEAWFDHDLGDQTEPGVGNGHMVLDWLEEETATNPDFEPPPELHVLTGNATQWDRMDQVIRRIKERPWEGRVGCADA